MPRDPKPRTEDRRPRKNTPFCKCGDCPSCRNNAKWDRIFREKFEDPEYYSRSRVTIQSTLNSFKSI